jgi:hypothetical protein
LQRFFVLFRRCAFGGDYGQARAGFQSARTGMSAAGDTAPQRCRDCLRCRRAVCAPSDISAPSPVTDRTTLANRFRRESTRVRRGAATRVLSARCVGAAARAGTRMSRRSPTHLGLPQGELFGVRRRAAHARSIVATQSLQRRRRRALPLQRTASRLRNFALDLPLVA